MCRCRVADAFMGALVRRFACLWVNRWFDIFTRPVLVYASVNGYADVYVYVRVCVYVSVHEYVAAAAAVAVYVYVNPSIHLCARAEN